MKTGDKLIMSQKECQRQVILSEVISNRRTLKSASGVLGVSYRQSKRLLSRYRSLGPAGLVHRGRGKTSNRAYSKELKEKVINYYKEDYEDFGPQLACEYLKEDKDICISRETLRQWLKAEELWKTKRKRKGYRQRRERRKRFGELLQIDGSDHHWFGKEHPRHCLLNIVDDAKGITLSKLATGETTQVLLEVLREWVLKYGIPQEVYVDLKSVYISPKQGGFSVFQRVCKELGIKINKAYSAQAKGRVERNHAVYQDRLVKGLRRRKITCLEKANQYLSEVLINQLNEKFAKPAQDPQDGHCPAGEIDLEQIFCWKYSRLVKNDRTFQYGGEHYQLLGNIKTCQAGPRKKIEVRIHLDGKQSAWYKDKRLSFRKIADCSTQKKAKNRLPPVDSLFPHQAGNKLTQVESVPSPQIETDDEERQGGGGVSQAENDSSSAQTESPPSPQIKTSSPPKKAKKKPPDTPWRQFNPGWLSNKKQSA